MSGRLQRRVVGTVLVGVGFLSGCGGGTATASLTSQPTDLESGRALARAVAVKAGCGSFEDALDSQAAYWGFTCIKGDTEFSIATATDSGGFVALAQTNANNKISYKAGDHFIVLPMLTGGLNAGPKVLDPFPGTLYK